MKHPWKQIELEIYEQHMTLPEVQQLQTLSRITREQLDDHDCTLLGICGAAGGNGLEHVDIHRTCRVYALDINAGYLSVCRERYQNLAAVLELVPCDLGEPGLRLPATTLLICNLIVEYLGVDSFSRLIAANHVNTHVISCVVQQNNRNDFVSASPLAKHFDPLAAVHHDVKRDELTGALLKKGLSRLREKEYELPNGKSFVRLDFVWESGGLG
ncbi:MAG TPA: class I SAM-dependent methyltransferase [Patescibacteria group bacterium]|nr:class I SAM-dependent methyltransferase [Patescibacteria group bacterium]